MSVTRKGQVVYWVWGGGGEVGRPGLEQEMTIQAGENQENWLLERVEGMGAEV